MSIKIAALWRREYIDRDTGKKQYFYSGDMEWPGVKGRVTLNINDKKGNDKAPDLVLVYESSEPRKENLPQGQETVPEQPHEDGDIPFYGRAMASRQIARNVRTAEAKDFVKALESLTYSRSRWDVFSDWCVMASSAIYNRLHANPEVEKSYLERAARYKSEELKVMGEMLAIATLALEDQKRDFMGEVHEGSLLASSGHGQFFTPFSVSRMVAAMNIVPASLPQDRIVTISDPASGAGGMLIAAAAELEEAGFDYPNWAYFEARDIDPICARMAYIQLSLIGASALVICGDTLKMECEWAWATPAYWATFMGPRLRNQIEREGAPRNKPETATTKIETPHAPREMQLEFVLA